MKTLFRLRVENKIVGFKKQMGNFTFFSKDLYGWNGKALNYQHADVFSGFKDKHDRKLFEEDIVKLNQYPNQYFNITFDKTLNKFYLVNYQTATVIDKDIHELLSNKNQIDRVAYSFEQKEM